MKRRRLGWLVVVAAGVLSSSAAEPPDAWDLLKQLNQYLRKVPAIRFEADIRADEISPAGRLVERQQHMKALVVRPDRLRVDLSGERGDLTVQVAGGVLTVYEPSRSRVATFEAGGTVAQVLDQVYQKFGVSLPLEDLFDPEFVAGWKKSWGEASWLGESRVGERTCHQIAFRMPGRDGQIWVDVGKEPFPRKLSMTYTGEAGKPRFSAVLRDWKTATSWPEDEIAWSAPDDARVCSMDEILAPEGGQE